MASSSDRDKDWTDSQPKSDNPFIKFRQFADSQISSLLQGIIGLPSAFSRTPPGNARWADFDDDLRRRDELRARQSELRDSEPRRLNPQPDGDDVETSGQQWSAWGSSPSDTSTNEEDQMDAKTAWDLPLYSPVTKSLFAHLQIPREQNEGDDWKSAKPFFMGELLLGTSAYVLPFHLKQRNPMRALQISVYNDLNNSPFLRSQYSLLPYLLFSPYSPIQLSSRMQPPSHRGERDDFPYLQAFEELILITQGRHSLDFFASPFSFFCSPTDSFKLWIEKLHMRGILQQSETQDIPLSITRQISFPKLPADQRPEYEKTDAQTEQDMYERFLRRASSPTSVAETMDSLFMDMEAWIEKAFSDLELPEAKRKLNELMESQFGKKPKNDNRSSLGEVSEAVDKTFDDIESRPVKRETMDWPQGRRTFEKFSESKTRGAWDDEKRRVGADPDRVVSTSTTSERTMNEDGSVETSVTVWKRFADGRETVTTTRHSEDPARDGDGNPEPRREEAEHAPGEEKPEDPRKKKKSEKKGWFWN